MTALDWARLHQNKTATNFFKSPYRCFRTGVK